MNCCLSPFSGKQQTCSFALESAYEVAFLAGATESTLRRAARSCADLVVVFTRGRYGTQSAFNGIYSINSAGHARRFRRIPSAIDLPARLVLYLPLTPLTPLPLMELAGGRLALSVETNKPYLDASRWYQRVVYLYSEDQGRSWSAPHTVSQDPTGRMFNWDQRAGVAPDGRIVTFTWYFDSQTGTYLNIQRRISRDQGRIWTDPEDLGFPDQAAHARHPARRQKRCWPGWTGSAPNPSGPAWPPPSTAPSPPESEVLIYDHAAVLRSQPSAGETMADTLGVMSHWTYGLPYATVLSNGEVLLVYYAGLSQGMEVEWGPACPVEGPHWPRRAGEPEPRGPQRVRKRLNLRAW